MVIKVKYNGEWVKIPYLSSDHGQELVEEAPKDGSQYARQNGIWSVVNIPEVDFTEVYNAIDTKVDMVDIIYIDGIYKKNKEMSILVIPIMK